MLGCMVSALILWRKQKARLCERDRKWRYGQLARLESLTDRMNVEVVPAPMGYPELPRARLAGLLPPPRNAQFERR